jgi:hypothetical protein
MASVSAWELSAMSCLWNARWRLPYNWRKLWKLRSHGPLQGLSCSLSCTVQEAPQPRHCTPLTHGTEFRLTFRHRASLSDSDAQRVKQASLLHSHSSGAAGNASETREPRPTCASAVDRSAARQDLLVAAPYRRHVVGRNVALLLLDVGRSGCREKSQWHPWQLAVLGTLYNLSGASSARVALIGDLLRLSLLPRPHPERSVYQSARRHSPQDLNLWHHCCDKQQSGICWWRRCS